MKNYVVVFLALLGLFQPAGAVPEVIDKVIATVNEEMLSLSEFNAVFVKFAMRAGINVPQEELKKARKEIFNQLLENKLLLQEARNRNIEVGKREIENAVENAKKSIGGAGVFAEQLKKEGLTEPEYREMIKDSMLAQRLIAEAVRKDIKVEIKDYQGVYEKNIGKFREEDKVELYYIFIKSGAGISETDALKKTENIIKELKDGLAFEAAAKKYSETATAKEDGGALGTIKPGDMPSLGMEPFKINIGDISGAVKIPGGFCILKVTGKTAGKQYSLADEITDKDGKKISVREVAQRMALEEKFKIKYDEFIKKIKEKSVINIKLEEFK